MADEKPLLIGLIRVSTEKQAESGLGQTGQGMEIERYCARVDGELIETYEEVESGKHNDIRSRPKLQAAVEHALEIDGTLVIAKLDRMVRSTAVMEHLRSTKVKFVACDNPHANELTIDILVAVAANEARMISTRTKAALKAYRDDPARVSRRIHEAHGGKVPADVVEARGGKLGASLPECRNLTDEARARGRSGSIRARQEKARKTAEAIGRLVTAWMEQEPGISHAELARRLNAKRRKTPRGAAWTGRQVSRVLGRIGSA